MKPVTQLERMRHELKLTQLGLARVLGVSRSTVIRWERGREPHRVYMSRMEEMVREQQAQAAEHVEGATDEVCIR